jgi:GTP-binding protein
MKIQNIQFIKGVVVGGELPELDLKQIVFMGRSNVGKSSTINSLLNQKGVARTSATPGLTQQVNFFLINKNFYLVDVPGYGYAKGGFDKRDSLEQLIEWYLTYPGLEGKQKIVLIIDAKVGVTDTDRQMLNRLEDLEKDIVVIANKIDKLKKNDIKKQVEKIEVDVHPHKVLPYSAEKKIGIQELITQIFR